MIYVTAIGVRLKISFVQKEEESEWKIKLSKVGKESKLGGN